MQDYAPQRNIDMLGKGTRDWLKITATEHGVSLPDLDTPLGNDERTVIQEVFDKRFEKLRREHNHKIATLIATYGEDGTADRIAQIQEELYAKYRSMDSANIEVGLHLNSLT